MIERPGTSWTPKPGAAIGHKRSNSPGGLRRCLGRRSIRPTDRLPVRECDRERPSDNAGSERCSSLWTFRRCPRRRRRRPAGREFERAALGPFARIADAEAERAAALESSGPAVAGGDGRGAPAEPSISTSNSFRPALSDGPLPCISRTGRRSGRADRRRQDIVAKPPGCRSACAYRGTRVSGSSVRGRSIINARSVAREALSAATS